MTFATRTILILTLTLAFTAGAQETATTATAAPPAQTETAAAGAETAEPAQVTGESRESDVRTRELFVRELRAHPPELARLFVLDPSLLSNEAFLVRYPDIAEFLRSHPQIRRNPHYFLRDFSSREEPVYRSSAFEEAIESLTIMFVVGLITFALAWVIRTFIEQKRWNQLARRQSEVHNKVLDRFNSSEELLTYIKTPAGSKFLESAPIALHIEPVRQSGPQARVLWSIQIGVVVAAAGLGMLLVAMAFSGESAQGFFAMGMIAFSIGAGFVASALISMAVAKRLAPWQERDPQTGDVVDEPGLMR